MTVSCIHTCSAFWLLSPSPPPHRSPSHSLNFQFCLWPTEFTQAICGVVGLKLPVGAWWAQHWDTAQDDDRPPTPESISSQGRVGQMFLVTIYCHYSMQERTCQAKWEGRVSVQEWILLRNGKKELHDKYFNSFVKIIVWFKIWISWNN